MEIDFKTVFETVWPFLKAIIIFIIGHYIVKFFVKVPLHALNKTSLDKSLVKILIKTFEFVGNFIVFLSALAAMGISTTGLLASLSAVAVSLALAMKDSLSSIAGGILLLAIPRFSTGDFVRIDNEEGFVDEIHLLHTTIRTYDNRHVTFSNGFILNSKVENFTWDGKHRLDLVFPIPYSADTELAKEIANSVVDSHPDILPKEAGTRHIRVGEYGDSAVKLHVFVWVKRENYIAVYYDLLEKIRDRFKENGIDVPFNQLDVHLDNKH